MTEPDDQKIWTRIAERIRRQLSRRIGGMSEMEPEELGMFLDAIDQAFFFHMNAKLWDKRIELEEMRSFPE
jgi:hypothetical protein